jgi:hypothetical protein
MHAYWRNQTWDVVDRCADQKILDSKWVFTIKLFADGSIDKSTLRLMSKGIS